MKTVRVSDPNAIDETCNVLRAGGVVLYPTDTLYGLGADALSDEAVDMIYHIKGREEKKPIHAIVADLAMAERYAEVNDVLRESVLKLPKGKITFICKKRKEVDSGICRGIETFGFRIPDNDFCIAMVRAFGKPITATSANKSGEKAERSVEKILAQLSSEKSYSSVLQKTSIRNIDLVIDAGELPACLPSTVVDFSEGEPHVLREGAISAASLRPPSR